MATFPSPLPVLLPDSAQLDVESLNFTDEAIVMIAGASGDTASCPLCGVSSCHVHSRKVFAERFPNLSVPYGRQTNRYDEALQRDSISPRN